MNAVDLYRIGRACHLRHVPFVPNICKALTYLLCNSIVPYTAEIGAGSRLAYCGIGVVIHSQAKIGRRVIIGQNVTIGRQLEPEGVPVLGDDIYIGPGARILGAISIGNNVIVGANSVVIRDVPADRIVAGVPAREIRVVEGDIWSLLKNIF